MHPILDEHTLDFISRSPDQTRRLGARLGELLQGGEVVCLEGPLGAGKTCMAQGIGRGWGAAEPLVSPTFVLVREYARPADSLRLHHIDLYRVSGEAEALSLGLEEVLGEPFTICVVEWAERARSLMPESRLWIQLDFADHTSRTMRLNAQGERHTQLLGAFRQAAFGA
jgi:tRNA threonylcarbamoyladenosine biosynthesis protein TsaE